MQNNKVVIFSAPSGSGKTTLVKYCLELFPELEFSISCTTRKPRGSEQDGLDYHFLTPEAFQEKISNNEFVEYEEVYPGKYYGTLKSEVERIWNHGNIVIFDVDVVGGVRLKTYFGSRALSVFIMPPSIEELERRLVTRATDNSETIKIRMAKAKEELLHKDSFDKVIINNDLHTAKREAESLISQFKDERNGDKK